MGLSTKVKYLGHFITDALKDDEVIYRQCHTLYAQANSLCRKFVSLLPTLNYSKAGLHKLQVAHSDSMRILHSHSEMFVAAGVNMLQSIVRMLFTDLSDNKIIMALTSFILAEGFHFNYFSDFIPAL